MIEVIIFILFGAAANACFSYFLDFTFNEGMIFEKWLPFLERTITTKSFWYKPLGGCATCANIWHGLFSFWFFVAVFSLWHLGWRLIPFYIAYLVISNTILRKLNTDY